MKKQAIKYYLSRMSAMLALGMCIDSLATFLDYQLVGESFRAIMSFGTVMQTMIMTHVALVMLCCAGDAVHRFLPGPTRSAPAQGGCRQRGSLIPQTALRRDQCR
jgi:hypothetical protein